MKIYSKLVIASAVLISFVSCKKENNAPIIPEIHHISMERQGSDALWIIGFKDGDGDIGVKKSTEEVDNEVLHLTLYGKKNNDFVAETSYGYSIDYIENINPNRPLEGKLEIEITGLDFIGLEYNSFYYEAYLEDRAGHKSNVIESPVLAVN